MNPRGRQASPQLVTVFSGLARSTLQPLMSLRFSQSVRRTDAQNEDLEKALDTLLQAIRKIDVETRTRFKETFDLVNAKLQQLFPKLFGGGHAYLEMTGEDLLDTGVGLMARPWQAKRQHSSAEWGREGATAIALVFSIFNLNPAPFCMLDEVDAPLDDANVGRFCELVKEMSRSVQFITSPTTK